MRARSHTKKLGEQLRLPLLKLEYVPVTAGNRFDAIEKHDADLLCEPTSATLSRRKRVDFSIPTFVDGASLLTIDMSLGDLAGLAGHKIGVLAGTTTEEALHGLLKARGIAAEVVPANTHNDGFAMLEAGEIFGDRSVLLFLLKDISNEPEKLRIAERLPHGSSLTRWPYREATRISAWPSIRLSATFSAATRSSRSSTRALPGD